MFNAVKKLASNLQICQADGNKVNVNYLKQILLLRKIYSLSILMVLLLQPGYIFIS